MNKIDIRKTNRSGIYEIRTLNGWVPSTKINVGDYVYNTDGEITQLDEHDVVTLPEKKCIKYKIKRFFIYRYLRTKVWINHYMRDHNHHRHLTADQEDMIKVIKKAILDPDADLYVNNLKDISYIYIEPASVFVKIEGKYAYVTNSVSNYILPIPENEYKDIMKMYEKRKSIKMDAWERKIVDKNRKSLQQILIGLENSQKKRKQKDK